MKTTTMEEQNNQTNQNQTSMKTKIISIPQWVASHILQSLGENNISSQYMGIDQSGRILMQINFEEGQEKFIRELSDGMKESEQAINFLLQIANAALLDALEKHKASLLIQKTKKEKLTL